MRAPSLRAAAVLACLWTCAVQAPPAAAQAPRPEPGAQPADPVAPEVPDARPQAMALRLATTGAVAASVEQQAPSDDAHLCATLTLADGRRDTLLRFGADPGASVLDPAGTGLVLTATGADDTASSGAASSGLGPRDGSVQVAIGGQTFFGSTQPGAPFRLALSLLPGRDGGRFVARHLTDRSGRQVIDLAGAWRCAEPPAAVAAASRLADPAPVPAPVPGPAPAPAPALEPAPEPAPTSAPASAPAPAREPADTAAAAIPAGSSAPAVPAPSDSIPPVPAPDVPALPSATAFRHLLAELGQAAPPDQAARPPAAAAAIALPGPEFASRRVFIHYRAGSRRGAAVADDLARTLDPQFARTVIRTVAATPSDPEIRYFHAQDAAAADALARRLGGASSPWHVRAFTNAAEPGLLEVWIPER